jgi:hypothetical protein
MGRPGDVTGRPLLTIKSDGWVSGDKNGCETYDLRKAWNDLHSKSLPKCAIQEDSGMICG